MKNKDNVKQLFLYLLVGGGATIVEWIAFFLFEAQLHIHYMIATGIAFIISTFANWALGRIVMFQSNQSIWKELAKIYLTGIAGFLMNLLIMWIAVQQMHCNEMFAKVIATGIVFFWNFMIRKLIIYKA